MHNDTTEGSTSSPTVIRIVKSALALFLILVAVAISLELAARVLTRKSSNPQLHRLVQDYGRLAKQGPDWIRFVPDETLSYRLRPGFSTTNPKDGNVTRHNNDGFRDDADFGPKSPTTLRICCFGASTTYGVSVGGNEDTYPEQLELKLRDAARGAGWADVEVFNLGVGGYTSREILGTMERMIPALKPDIVLLQNGINDVIPRFYPDFQADYSHFRTAFTPLTLSAGNQIAYRSHAWLTLAQGLGWLKPLSLQSQTQRAMPSVDEALSNLQINTSEAFRQNLQSAVSLAEVHGAKVWLLTQAYLDVPAFAGPTEASRRLEGGYRSGLEEHIEVVKSLAESHHLGLVPLHEIMPRDQRLFADPIHMRSAGNTVKAELVAAQLGTALPTPPQPGR